MGGGFIYWVVVGSSNVFGLVSAFLLLRFLGAVAEVYSFGGLRGADAFLVFVSSFVFYRFVYFLASTGWGGCEVKVWGFSCVLPSFIVFATAFRLWLRVRWSWLRWASLTLFSLGVLASWFLDGHLSWTALIAYPLTYLVVTFTSAPTVEYPLLSIYALTVATGFMSDVRELSVLTYFDLPHHFPDDYLIRGRLLLWASVLAWWLRRFGTPKAPKHVWLLAVLPAVLDQLVPYLKPTILDPPISCTLIRISTLPLVTLLLGSVIPSPYKRIRERE